MRLTIDWANRYLSTVTGRFWCPDYTFATAKCVRDANQLPVYKAVLTVVNEYCQVVAQWFTVNPHHFTVGGQERLGNFNAAQTQATWQYAAGQPSTFQSGASTARCVLALAGNYTSWSAGN